MKFLLSFVFAALMSLSAVAQTTKDYGFDVTFAGTPTVKATATSAQFEYRTKDYPGNGFVERVYVTVYDKAPVPASAIAIEENFLSQSAAIDDKKTGTFQGNPAEQLFLTRKTSDPEIAVIVVRDTKTYLVVFSGPRASTTAGDNYELFFQSFRLLN